jgi:flagellar biosynthesis protein FlhB
MAEESDLERTEPASPRRLEQARDEGQVAHSPELSTFTVLMAGTAGLWLLGGALAGDLSALVRDGLRISREAAFNPALAIAGLHIQAMAALQALAPFLLIVFAAALAAPLLLNGWLFSPRAIAPDFGRIDPLQGFARMFSLRSLVELAKSLAKAALIGGVAAWVFWQHREALLDLSSQPLPGALAGLSRIVALSLFAVVGAMVLIVAVDVPYQLWEYHRKLRMTRDEMRKELKETEGDPQVKARVRSMQRAAARKRMMAEIPKADVVVTNPTHYAVALSYRAGKMRAPKVVAKGSHLLAERIRHLAREHGVPLLEAPALARALYHHADVGDAVPEALYAVVAEVLAYVYQLKRYQVYGGAAPRAPGELPVPPELDPAARTA